MGTVGLGRMVFHAGHGVYEEERSRGNVFVVDVSCKVSLAKPGETDDLVHALDYEGIFRIVQAQMEGETANLLEHLLYRIAAAIFSAYPEIKKLTIRIAKQNPPLPGTVGESYVKATFRPGDFSKPGV